MLLALASMTGATALLSASAAMAHVDANHHPLDSGVVNFQIPDKIAPDDHH